ncbi:MAG: metalloregulator ArsR/SmtB family transcription factor [candidate division Zixibacteria bacterium]|nr:metalloregulator ArsR/SmtB family transcription factor [candidate division Zixibacteria bacterium]
MDPKTQGRFDALAAVIKAMAHPTRLFVVDELSRGERCVYELTELIGADISTVSKHLAVLKGCGIVEAQRRGSRIYYRLKMPCVLSFFGCVETVIKSDAEERLGYVE